MEPFIGMALSALLVLAICRIAVFYKRLLVGLHGHFWTAFLWSCIALITTIIALSSSENFFLVLLFSQVVSSWATISSWRQLFLRQRLFGKETYGRGAALYRLLLQTILGPLSLLICSSGVHYWGSCHVENALASNNMVQIHLLHYYGFPAVNLDDRYSSAVSKQDIEQTATCLEADSNLHNYCSTDTEYLNIATLSLLLHYRVTTPNDALLAAIPAGRKDQVIFLLRRGASSNARGWVSGSDSEKTALQLAHQGKDRAIVRLLKEAGATY